MRSFAVRFSASESGANVTFRSLFSLAWRLFASLLLAVAAPRAAQAQLAPGPYELPPVDDGCIIEAFRDLHLSSGNMADWTGWSGTDGSLFLISPHPYDGHIGTDFSVQTGTALHPAAGTVTGIETKYARDTFANDYGNYGRIAVDTRSPNGELLDLTYCHMRSLSHAATYSLRFYRSTQP